MKDKKLVQNSRILFYVISYMRGISSSYVFPNNKAECVSYCIYTSYVQANRVQRVYMEFYFFFLRLLFSMSYFLKPASCCYCCFYANDGVIVFLLNLCRQKLQDTIKSNDLKLNGKVYFTAIINVLQ